MGITAISSGTSFDATSMAQSLIKKIDTNNDGGISKSEFQAALNKSTSSASSSQDSVNLFSYLDSNNDGSVTQSELESFLKKLSTATNSSNSSNTGTAASSGAGGGGGGGAGGVSSASSSSSTSGSSTSLVYDVRDTNQDGVVSSQEELAYEAKHPNAAVKTQNSASGNSQFQNAINQYQQSGLGGLLQNGGQSQLSLSG
jgi:hypothetical protein